MQNYSYCVASHSAAFLLSVACYLNSLSGELVHDDIFAVRDNQDLRSSTPIAQLLRDDFWGEPMRSLISHKSYGPLTVLTFGINYALHEFQPWVYHVINVLLHGLATILFGIVCHKVVYGCTCRSTGVRGWSWWEGLPFTAMMLFASHPVHTEAVTGIVGRADVLSCIFFLLSLLVFHFSAAVSHISISLSMIKLLLSLVCGAAAMLCKEHGATVLGVCMVYDVFILNREIILRCVKKRDWFSPSLRPFYLRSILLLLTTSLLLGFRVWLLHGHLPHFSAQDNPASFAESLTTRILTYACLFFFNAKLLVFPSTLCYDWQMGSIPLVKMLSDLRNFGALTFFIFLLSLSLTSLFGWSSKSHRRVTMLGLSLLVIPFLPASNLFLRVGFVVAERILYIPRYSTHADFQQFHLIGKLSEHTRHMQLLFSDLVESTIKFLEHASLSLKDLIELLDAYIPDECRQASDLDDFFCQLLPHMSFLNYDLLTLIIQQCGCNDLDEKLSGYEKEFESYCRSRISEARPLVFADESHYDTQHMEKMLVKLDTEWNGLSRDDIKRFQCKLASILQIRQENLLIQKVEKGCVLFTIFIRKSLVERNLSGGLSADQEHALCRIQVISITVGSVKFFQNCTRMTHSKENEMQQVYSEPEDNNKGPDWRQSKDILKQTLVVIEYICQHLKCKRLLHSTYKTSSLYVARQLLHLY